MVEMILKAGIKSGPNGKKGMPFPDPPFPEPHPFYRPRENLMDRGGRPQKIPGTHWEFELNPQVIEGVWKPGGFPNSGGSPCPGINLSANSKLGEELGIKPSPICPNPGTFQPPIKAPDSNPTFQAREPGCPPTPFQIGVSGG